MSIDSNVILPPPLRLLNRFVDSTIGTERRRGRGTGLGGGGGIRGGKLSVGGDGQSIDAVQKGVRQPNKRPKNSGRDPLGCPDSHCPHDCKHWRHALRLKLWTTTHERDSKRTESVGAA